MDVLNYFVYTFYFVNIKYFQLVLTFPGSFQAEHYGVL